jgi:hypothetical protein
MKNLTAPDREKAKKEGLTQVELAAEIRRCAYEIYERRGRVDGHAQEDWAQAEAEVLKSEQRPNAA